GALSHARHAPVAPVAPVASTPGSATRSEDPKLRKVAQQMEGVFVQELYKAMRATVPQNDGAVGGGAGEEMFTSLMDQHLATETPHAWGRGLGAAIYEHLRGRLARESGESGVSGAAPTAPAGPVTSLDAPQAARTLAEPPARMPLQQQSSLQPLPRTLHPTLPTPSRDAGR
ncbi:MAG: rod-binding protein, partial [Gemmatirosa sp.]